MTAADLSQNRVPFGSPFLACRAADQVMAAGVSITEEFPPDRANILGVIPPPLTHVIWTVFKAGEPVYLM